MHGNVAGGRAALGRRAPASTGVTGQVFKVMGGQVQLLRGWRPVTEANDDKPWTIDSIEANSATLFGSIDRGVPPFMPNIGDA